MRPSFWRFPGRAFGRFLRQFTATHSSQAEITLKARQSLPGGSGRTRFVYSSDWLILDHHGYSVQVGPLLERPGRMGTWGYVNTECVTDRWNLSRVALILPQRSRPVRVPRMVRRPKHGTYYGCLGRYESYITFGISPYM